MCWIKLSLGLTNQIVDIFENEIIARWRGGVRYIFSKAALWAFLSQSFKGSRFEVISPDTIMSSAEYQNDRATRSQDVVYTTVRFT